MKVLFIVMVLFLGGCKNLKPADCPESKAAGKSSVDLNFDGGTLEGWGHHFSHEEAAKVVEDPLNKDNMVVRFKLEEGEIYTTRSGASYRSELYERYKAPIKVDIRYSFRVYIGDEWENDDIRALIAQWHGSPDLHLGEVYRSPNLGIEYRDDKFLIRMNTSKVKVNRDNKKSIDRRTLYLSEVVEKNRWYEFVVDVRWTHEDDGYFDIWIEGKKVVEYRGGTAYNDCIGPYFKMGIYRDDTPKTFVIYHDDYKREIVEYRGE